MNREDREQHKLLKKTMIKTFEKLKNINLNRKSNSLWFGDNDKVRVCIMTSKIYSFTQKYWFTLTKNRKSFLEHSQESYVFLGFLDDDQFAYLIPYFDYKNDFLSCDTTKTGWQIRINHHLKWYFPNNDFRIDLLKFKEPLTSLEKSLAEYKNKSKTEKTDLDSKKPKTSKYFPKAERFYWPCLQFVSSKGSSGAKLEEIKQDLIDRFALSPEQQRESVKSGRISKLYNRTNFALSHLKRLKFISKQYETGAFCIQPKGRTFYKNENEKSLIDRIRDLQRSSSKDSRQSEPDCLYLLDMHTEIKEEVKDQWHLAGTRSGSRFTNIVLNVYNRLESYIKETVQHSGHNLEDLFGIALIEKVFSIRKPLIDVSDRKDNRLTRENKRASALFLFKGICKMRNILAHENRLDLVSSKKNTLEILAFLSFLFRLTDKGRLKQK